jgi:S-adenosyl methyltransferase
VAYVDHDPVVAAHGRALLATSDNVVFVEADLRAPETILSDSGLRALIDFSEPVAVLLVAVLHFLADEDGPHRVVGTLRDALCGGSHLVISHAVHRGRAAEMEAAQLYTERASVPLVLRTREDIAGFFEGFELVEPGLPPVPLWRPLVRPRARDAVPIVGGVGALRADSRR